jgi:hypothetical protein
VTTARFIVGDSLTVLRSMPDASVDLVLTSPPFLALRSYLPLDHPDKALEMGSEPTPGEFIDALLEVVEECRRVVAPHGVPEAATGWMAWLVVEPADARQCRFTNGGVRCHNQSVAKIQRGRKAEQWWHYCGDHLYGRVVDGRRIWVIHTIRIDENEP